MDEKINLEKLWKNYLKVTGLKEEEMHKIQLRETKRAFYGGVGQLLVTLRHDLTSLSDDDAVKALEQIHNQVHSFWLKETQQLN